jgi:hypothetical protein
MLVISGRDEARPDQRIWGSPSWLSPERREAVDWVTLARFLGWGCVVVHATDAALNLEAGRPRVIIVACEPDVLSEKLKAALLFTLQAENVLVLARAGETGKPWTQLAGCDAEAQCNGRLLEWIGPGPGSRWHTRRRFGAKRLHCNADVAPWLTLDGSTIVAARQIGRGTVVTLGLHPSGARDQEGCATAFLKHLLLCGTSHDMPALNWANTMILRMDDPGAPKMSTFGRGITASLMIGIGPKSDVCFGATMLGSQLAMFRGGWMTVLPLRRCRSTAVSWNAQRDRCIRRPSSGMSIAERASTIIRPSTAHYYNCVGPG